MQTQGFDFRSHQLVAGVDEVGRGPLVGKVVAAAVILDPDNPVAGLTDSKKLTEKNVSCCTLKFRKKHLPGRLPGLM